MVPWAHWRHPSNGTLIGSAIFAKLTNVTNWQSDRHHATPFVAIGQPSYCCDVVEKDHGESNNLLWKNFENWSQFGDTFIDSCQLMVAPICTYHMSKRQEWLQNNPQLRPVLHRLLLACLLWFFWQPVLNLSQPHSGLTPQPGHNQHTLPVEMFI